jgi:gluconate 2-dehydrogenase gamma chain
MASNDDRFFDDHQRRTIEAAMARIIPTDDRPGAREAGTIDFLDRYLSGIDRVYAKPDGSGFERLGGKRAAAWRQRIEAVQKTYVAGVEEMDRRSRTRFGEPFVALSDEQQDAVLTELEQAAPESAAELDQAQATAAWAPVEPAMQQTSAEVDLAFLPLLALHTRQGFYADPVYGGNRDRVGWQLIGFEGPTSLAETHAGRYTTRPFFAEEPIDWETGDRHGR